MTAELDARARTLVADLGLGGAKDVTAFTGAVASDIARIVLHGRPDFRTNEEGCARRWK